MTEDKSPSERERHREKTLVGRDKASRDTVAYMNNLRDKIEDPAAAELTAMLHAQVNGSHPDYTRPPDREPFGHWHHSLTVRTPSVVNTEANTATVEVTLSEFRLFDTNAGVHLRFIEQTDTPDNTVVKTSTQSVSKPGTLQFSTSSLSADTEYAVQAVAEASVDVQDVTEYSDLAVLTTDA
jgi:hypothetical protein